MKLATLVFSGLMAITACGVSAQTYPVRPIKLFVPSTPGSGQDTTARVFAQKLTHAWGQQVVVENRPGGGGNIAASAVAKSEPDGYTLLVTATSLAVAPAMYRKLPFDPVKDFAPISQITSTYLVLVVHPSLPGRMHDLVAYAKSHPGMLNYGHTGLASGTHLIGEMLKASTGIDVALVTYKGDAQTLPALLSNEIQMGFTPPTNALPVVKAGRLKAVAVSGAKRSKQFPDVPTTAEAGFPDVYYTGWTGAFAPAGTPHDILNKISAEIASALHSPDVIAFLEKGGGEAEGTTPEEFSARYIGDIERYTKLIRAAHIPHVDQ
jgi:tripartite-type tricarboxylate transporter receptor subunit TctC